MLRLALTLLIHLMLLTLALSAPARAEPSFIQRTALYGRVNPLGLTLETDSVMRLSFGVKDDLLFGTAHFDTALSTSISPVLIGLGGSFELEPIAFLVLRGRVLRLHYFGTFDAITELESLDADWSEDALAAREQDTGHRYEGTMLDLGAQLRFALGHVVALADLRWTAMSLEAESPYYEPYADLLLTPNDDFFVASAIGGWRFGESTLAGLRWELTTGMDAGARDRRQTLGVIGHHELALADDLGLAFDAQLALYLDDAYRTGEPVFACAITLTYAP